MKKTFKNPWKCIFTASWRMSFSYFLQIMWIMLQYSIQALCSIKDEALCDKLSNGWELLLTVVT